MTAIKTDIQKEDAFRTPFGPGAIITATNTQRAIEQAAGLTGAVAGAEFIVAALSGSLTAERLATSTATLSWDFATGGQAKANVLEVPGIAATGIVARTGAAAYTARTLTAPAAGITISNGNGVGGNPTLALANDLAALEGLASTGFAAHTAVDSWAERTLTAPAAGLTISNPAGVAGNPTFALANDLAALEGLVSTGLAVRSATDTWVQRTIAGTANEITATNGDGVAANPTLSLPAALTFTGKTVTGGTFSGVSLSGTTSLSNGHVFNWNSGDVLLTHSADTLTLTGATALAMTESSTGGVSFTITNANAGANADTRAILSNGTDIGELLKRGTGHANAGRLLIVNTHATESIVFVPNTIEEVAINNTATFPITNDGNALGTATLSWSDLFLADGAVINFNNGNVTITHASDLLTFSDNLALTAGYVDITEISTPSNPAANVARLYCRDDSTVTKLYFRDSAGTETAMGGGGGSVQVVIQTVAATGTYTPTAGMKYCIIEAQAPGGGGGGADAAAGSTGISSGGGGGGEYARGVFSAATIGASQSVTIGAVGTAGSNTGGNGGTGGNVSVGALISANGGVGGTGTGSDSATHGSRAGGAGGTGGAGGSFRVPGGPGQAGIDMQTTVTPNFSIVGGQGGNAILGFGGISPVVTDVAGNNGQNYGGGGSGTCENDAAGSAGGTGGAGIIIITEYI